MIKVENIYSTWQDLPILLMYVEWWGRREKTSTCLFSWFLVENGDAKVHKRHREVDALPIIRFDQIHVYVQCAYIVYQLEQADFGDFGDYGDFGDFGDFCDFGDVKANE